MLERIPADLCALITAITANVAHTARYANQNNNSWRIAVHMCGCVCVCQ